MRPLPVELYRIIAQYVERRRDLVSFSLASRSVQSEVEPELYRSLHLWDRFYTSTAWPHAAVVQILEQLANNPRLASYIHTLHISCYTNICPLVTPVLCATVNLKQLAIYISSGIPLDLHNFPTTFQLDWLAATVGKWPLEQEEIDFFERQAELREMEWHYILTPHYDLPFSLPKLRTLSLRGQAGARAILLQQTVSNLSQEDGFSGYQHGDVFTSVWSLKMSKPLEVRHAKQFPNLRYLSTTVSILTALVR